MNCALKLVNEIRRFPCKFLKISKNISLSNDRYYIGDLSNMKPYSFVCDELSVICSV